MVLYYSFKIQFSKHTQKNALCWVECNAIQDHCPLLCPYYPANCVTHRPLPGNSLSYLIWFCELYLHEIQPNKFIKINLTLTPSFSLCRPLMWWLWEMVTTHQHWVQAEMAAMLFTRVFVLWVRSVWLVSIWMWFVKRALSEKLVISAVSSLLSRLHLP